MNSATPDEDDYDGGTDMEEANDDNGQDATLVLVNKLHDMALNFKLGALDVHNNYLSLWKHIIKTFFITVVPLSTFFFLGYVINWFPATAESTRVVLESSLVYMGLWTENVIILPVRLYYYLATGRQMIWYRTGLSVPSKSVASMSHQRTWREYYLIIFMVPLVEEILYRLGIQTLFALPGRFIIRQKKETVSALKNQDGENENLEMSTRKLWGNLGERKKNTTYLPTWIMVSSVLFGLSHISNHLPTPTTTVVEQAVVKLQMHYNDLSKMIGKPMMERCFRFGLLYVPLLQALLHCSLCFTIALQSFCPLFAQKGLLSSFGAHVCWNVQSFQAFNLVFYRLLVRFLRRLAKAQKRSRRC